MSYYLTTLFWDKYRLIAFNIRQKKLLQRLLETDDFKDLTKKGILVMIGASIKIRAYSFLFIKIAPEMIEFIDSSLL